ncbi:hypothetical protein HD806DRAFT_476990 [Xylariaceae sp. AK1471]|nr:hypothetical protein HD806DRAFT_476990 [Xylariaceae sp. AK1471]
MAHQSTSISTISTAYASATSFEVVDKYTIDFGADGVPTATHTTQEWWAFGSTAPVSSLTTSTNDATHVLTTTTPTTSPSENIPATQPTSTAAQTTSTSGTSVPIPHTSLKSSGLSNGAIAGVAIATAIVGGLLGLIAGLLFARRGKKHRSPPEYVAYADREKEPATSPTTTDALQLDQFLLDSKPDTTIASELRSLGHLIQQHVESHYHLQPVQLESSRLRQPLSDLGIERGSAPAIARLASLAHEPRTRLNAIRYVIAKAVFESTVIGGSTCVSLLPAMVSGLGSSIPPVEDHIGSHEATELAITRWRQLSAFLLHTNRSQRTPLAPSEDVSTVRAQELTVALNRFLEPFISRDREERYEQENHLREVIAECATFGYVLFSQPTEYRFRFDSNGGLNTIVVCPGLDKIIDGEGRRYQSPVPQIVAPVVESI